MTKTILVIDDEPGYRALLEMDLAMDGHHVLTAEGGEQALRIIEKEQVDLIITDMRMSPMDGLQVIMAIKEKHPILPIVLMTGYAIEERVQKAMEYKPTAYVKKPFNLTDMRTAIKTLMETPPL